MTAKIKIRDIRPSSWGVHEDAAALACAYVLVEADWGWVEELPDPERHDCDLDNVAYLAAGAERDLEAARLVEAYWLGQEGDGLDEPERVYQWRDEWAYMWGSSALMRQQRVAAYRRDIIAEIWSRLGGDSAVMAPRRFHEITLGSLGDANRRRLGRE